MRRPWIFVLLCALWFTACTTSRQANLADCEALTAAALRTLIQADSLPPDLVRWLAGSYGLDPVAIASTHNETGNSLHWGIDGTDYTLDILATGVPEALVHFRERKPTTGQLVECLGPPERYRARYFFHPPGVNSLVFELYFPLQGLVATYVYQTTNLRRKNPPLITANTPIEQMYLDRSGAFEEFIRRRTGPPELAEMIINESKPWPGSWDQIEIDLGPFLGTDR